jgi:hypothetical protein
MAISRLSKVNPSYLHIHLLCNSLKSQQGARRRSCIPLSKCLAQQQHRAGLSQSMRSIWLSSRRHGSWNGLLSVAFLDHFIQLKFPFIGCGDVADESNNGGVVAPETDCATPCTGDPIHVRFVLPRATLKRISIFKECYLSSVEEVNDCNFITMRVISIYGILLLILVVMRCDNAMPPMFIF